MLHLRIGNDDCQIRLMPGRKHPEQPGLADDVAVQVRNGIPDRVFPFVADCDGLSDFFFAGGLFKAALEHNLRLVEPIGKVRSVFLPLFAQDDLLSPDFLIHPVSQSFLYSIYSLKLIGSVSMRSVSSRNALTAL